MNATQNDWERILDEAESLYKIRRRGCDMEPGEYAWCRRYLPPTRAEWQRRVEALIARLRRNHPCGGALAVSIGDREYNCAEGTLINAAFADGLVCNAEWKVAWEVDGPDLWNTPTGLALETMRDKTMCFLDDAGKRDIADAIERWEPIAVWEYPYRPDVEADPFNPYRKLSDVQHRAGSAALVRAAPEYERRRRCLDASFDRVGGSGDERPARRYVAD